MKGKSVPKVVKILAVLFLLTQLADIRFLVSPQGGANEAFADSVSCPHVSLAPGRSFNVPARQVATVSNDEATLNLDQTVLTNTTVLTITPVGPDDLPALDPGMTNVTKGPRCGYRLQPHPAHFAGAMQVSVPYSRSFIPPGLTDQDVKTFYFD